MTTPLIEAIAASLEPLVNDGMAEPFKSAWLTDLAQAALTAITEAGFVVCPREPTDAMLEAGHNLLIEHGCNPLTGDAELCWEAMINAVTHCNNTNNGKAE